MRLAVLSDIHGNRHALDAALADLDAVGGADLVWILGDLAAFGPDPVGCIERIRELPEETTRVIQGNTDRYLYSGARPAWGAPDEAAWRDIMARLRERDLNFGWTTQRLDWEHAEYLLKLPTDLDVEVTAFGWVIGFHAAPGDDELVLLPDTDDEEVLDALLIREGRLAFGGHTHRPMDRDLGAWRMVNPGAVGLPFDGDPRAAYALATFEAGDVQIDIRRVEYDVEAVIAALHEGDHPAVDWVAARLRDASPPTA